MPASGSPWRWNVARNSMAGFASRRSKASGRRTKLCASILIKPSASPSGSARSSAFSSRANVLATTDPAFIATMKRTHTTRRLPALLLAGAVLGFAPGSSPMALAQLDPYPRNLLQLGYDYPLSGTGPQSLYAFYYYNNPAFLRTNLALRLAVAPIYLDSEIGFRGLLSPHTDVGIGINGGGFGENYYEVRQGRYIKGQSFDGHGGGVSLNLYHLINPAHLIPLNVVVQGGAHYS